MLPLGAAVSETELFRQMHEAAQAVADARARGDAVAEAAALRELARIQQQHRQLTTTEQSRTTSQTTVADVLQRGADVLRFGSLGVVVGAAVLAFLLARRGP